MIGCSLVRGTRIATSARPWTKTGMRRLANRWSAQISQDQPDVALLIIGRWETVDRSTKESDPHR
ncbi:putative acyltransferase domain protein [Mycobacterium kansasii]|uniref:Putative acyltransferase domain protein n=1 Tax=Mycobacterium kansasii TaxID=1768 RepID=A0A1V3W8T2_MYCKA|nr:putative acyltransferase domain protein [Mycobacterium kansasii]